MLEKNLRIKIEKKGWKIVEGTEEIRVIYQRMW